MDKHGFAVIGIQGVGSTHIKGIQSLPNAELVALVDIDAGAVQAKAAELGVRAFTHYEEMLKLPEVEIVNIATPHPLHPEMAIAAMQAGKHVIVEKPMAVTTREAEQMVAVSRRTGRKLGVNYQSRVSARNRAIREIIRNDLGELYRMTSVSGGVRTQAYYESGAWRATWDQEGGGVLVNQAPHNLDQFAWFVGLPKQIKAWTTTQMHSIPVEDMADAILLYENGAVAHLHVNTLDVPGYSQLGFFGRRAALVSDGGGLRRSRLAQPLDAFIRDSPEAWGKLDSSWEPVETPPQEGPTGHAGIAADMIAAIEQNRAPVAFGEDGIASVELANAMILSSKRGKTVDLPVNKDEYDELLADLRAGRIR